MKTYRVYLSMKQKGSKNTIKFRMMEFSEQAIGKLMTTFIEQTILDPSYRAKVELGEGLEKAKEELKQEEDLKPTHSKSKLLVGGE